VKRFRESKFTVITTVIFNYFEDNDEGQPSDELMPMVRRVVVLCIGLGAVTITGVPSHSTHTFQDIPGNSGKHTSQ